MRNFFLGFLSAAYLALIILLILAHCWIAVTALSAAAFIASEALYHHTQED